MLQFSRSRAKARLRMASAGGEGNLFPEFISKNTDWTDVSPTVCLVSKERYTERIIREQNILYHERCKPRDAWLFRFNQMQQTHEWRETWSLRKLLPCLVLAYYSLPKVIRYIDPHELHTLEKDVCTRFEINKEIILWRGVCCCFWSLREKHEIE